MDRFLLYWKKALTNAYKIAVQDLHSPKSDFLNSLSSGCINARRARANAFSYRRKKGGSSTTGGRGSRSSARGAADPRIT